MLSIDSKRLQTLPTMTKQYGPKKGGEAIANNNDLLAEILVRLPVKSLVRFESVSKGWYSLISDHNFSRRLLPDSVVGLILGHIQYEFVPLIEKPSFHAPFNSLTFDDNPRGLKILHSCNGLLCCSSIYAYTSKHNYYIYNPTTNQFFKLPQVPIEDTVCIGGVGLAFDPAKSPYYKVVVLRQPDRLIKSNEHDRRVEFRDAELIDYVSYQIEIYSSKTRTWRPSGNPFNAAVGTRFERGVYCNGAIHWINDWDTSLYFNVDEEKLGEMPTMPPIPEGWEERRLRYLGESQNHLHIIELYGPRTEQFKIYEMKSDYSNWFVKYHVNLDAIPVAFPEMISRNLGYEFCIFCVVREANDEESYMVLHIPGKVIRYNLKDGSFKKICDLESYEDSFKKFFDLDSDEDNIDGIPIQTLRYSWYDAVQFIPTLFCLKIIYQISDFRCVSDMNYYVAMFSVAFKIYSRNREKQYLDKLPFFVCCLCNEFLVSNKHQTRQIFFSINQYNTLSNMQIF